MSADGHRFIPHRGIFTSVKDLSRQLNALHPRNAVDLAHNLLGGRFFEASCSLGGQTAGRCL